MSTRVVADTNVLVSALVFGGLPKQIWEYVLDGSLMGITSPALLAELRDVLSVKFKFSPAVLISLERKMKKRFYFVHPTTVIDALSDKADNRVLEAAVAGQAHYIITGDKGLLALTSYQGVVVTTPSKFLVEFNELPSSRR